MDFHRDAVAHLDTIPHNGQSEHEKSMRKWINSQDPSGYKTSGYNFLYGGGVYLTPSRSTALKYACPFGSEIVTQCNLLYRSIIEAEGGSQPSWFDSYPELLSVFQCPGKPLIVRVQGTRIRDLSDEYGREPLPRVTYLFAGLAEGEQKHAKERQRMDALRREARECDAAQAAVRHPTTTRRSAAIQAFLTLQDEGSRWTPKKILDVIGQQVNFQAKVVYSASEFEFEEVPPVPTQA
jgi:hypothetical protein